MINPEIEIARKFPARICSKSMNKRPIKPVMIAPKPVVPNAGIFGFALKRTKYRPSDIAVNNPQTVPNTILPSGAFNTLLGSVTTIIIPIRQKIEAYIVGLFNFSFKIIREKNAANNGPVAIQNKINATDELTIPSVKKTEPDA